MFDTLKSDLNAYMERDPAARSRFEIYFLYSGFKAVRAYRRANWFYRHNMKFIARWISQNARRRTGVEIHPGATIGSGLVIDHGMDILTYYAHLASIAVEEGDIVTKGQVIGKMGSTGYSTGTHLDLQLRINGIPVDPQTMYGYDPTKINLGTK